MASALNEYLQHVLKERFAQTAAPPYTYTCYLFYWGHTAEASAQSKVAARDIASRILLAKLQKRPIDLTTAHDQRLAEAAHSLAEQCLERIEVEVAGGTRILRRPVIRKEVADAAADLLGATSLGRTLAD